jgi:hypothetical protein
MSANRIVACLRSPSGSTICRPDIWEAPHQLQNLACGRQIRPHSGQMCPEGASRITEAPQGLSNLFTRVHSRLARRTTATIMRQVSRPHQSNVVGGPRAAPGLNYAANRQSNQCARGSVLKPGDFEVGKHRWADRSQKSCPNGSQVELGL